MMFDIGAGIHVCPLWFCEDYPIYRPQYPILLNGASGNPITVYGLRTVHLQLTADEKSKVYVQFVAADVTEPILSYQVLKANKVTVNLSPPEYASLPCGLKIPLEQHLNYLYVRIYRRIPAAEIENTSSLLSFAIYANRPLQACPTYSKST